MSLNSASGKGFTLVEVLVAIVLVGIAISALSTSLGAMTSAYRRSLEREAMLSLAQEKLDELVGTGEWQNATSGDFEGERYTDFSWELTTETTSIENLDYVKLTVTHEAFGRTETESAETLAYRATATIATTGGPATP